MFLSFLSSKNPHVNAKRSSLRSAVEAVNCAVEIQRALHERNLKAPPERRVRIRIGLHLGDVIFRDNDVFGDGVNIAARVEPLAEPGGICITEDVARQIRNKVEYPFHQLGERTLKNIEFPISVYRIDLPWLKPQPGKEREAKAKPAQAPTPALGRTKSHPEATKPFTSSAAATPSRENRRKPPRPLGQFKESIDQYQSAIDLGGTNDFNVPDLEKRLSTVRRREELGWFAQSGRRV